MSQPDLKSHRAMRGGYFRRGGSRRRRIGMSGPGLPQTLLANAGYADEAVVEKLQNRGIEPLIAVTR